MYKKRIYKWYREKKNGRELINSLSFENKAYINANIKNEYSDIKTNEIIER
jgi:hypothetical protein